MIAVLIICSTRVGTKEIEIVELKVIEMGIRLAKL